MAIDRLLAHIEPGDTLVSGQVLGEPTELLERLFALPIPDVTMFVGMSLTDVYLEAPMNVRLATSVGMPPNGELIAARRMALVPCHMSELPWLLSEGPLRTDVALVRVSPPDTDGFCSLGVGCDYPWHAVDAARVVLAEINLNVPRIAGDTSIHMSRFAATINSERPLPEYQRAVPSAVELTIGQHVAGYVRDGSCIQVGIGKLGEAVLQSVSDRRDLGVHSGMVGDTLLEMRRDGIVTNAHKPIDTGLTVAGSVLGSARGVALAASDSSLRLRSISHTHDPAVIAALDNFVCVNSALEIDLFGQVNSETAGTKYVGAIGGSVDYLRASVRAHDGHSIVALPAATGSGRSRIVPTVAHATSTRSDIDVVATEYGTAELRGVSVGERAHRLIQVAAPAAHEELTLAAKRLGL